MEIYDSLVFDFRKPEDLFNSNQSGKLYYADIIKRWAISEILTDKEQETLTGILIYYPDYVVNNNKIPEFIELLRLALDGKILLLQKSTEKGLMLYTLVYLLLKSGRGDEAVKELVNLELIIKEYNYSEDRIFDNIEITEQIITILISENDHITSPKAKTAKAYFDIISRIMDLKELLCIEPAFNIDQIPIPDTSILEIFYYNLRETALDLFNKNFHQTALMYYRILRLAKYELPGTLIHFVRVELSLGDINQSQVYTAMAWRLREKASFYVKGRILFMIILLNIIQSKPIEIWLACFKQLLKMPNYVMFWEIENTLNMYLKDMNSDNSKLLSNILNMISLNKDSKELNSLVIWQNTEPLSPELWPDYQIE